MTTLILMRHGAADWVTPDEERPLSATGIQQCQRQISARSQQLEGVGRLWVSPYLRARQTAEMLPLNTSVEHSRANWLTPDSDPERVIAELAASLSADTAMLVAHNPLLTRLLNRLLGAEPGRYHLGTSAMAAVELPLVAAGCGELLWFDPGF
ncbi:SixA phosphatase family protein [Motiliproteus sediminis]|uniref:SixA phosphatase family protein n=1 Tax=Motiliproteus sediminis TaxID=1468178 RepID=UPI001AEF9F96|nr:histidine phosphatase family protein [Motiliproteus sediminis]